MSASENWTMTMIELPGVIEGGMPGRNGQRKPGTTRGSPRPSRTAKASRISRPAVKSRCVCEWGGWGRLSDDGPGQHNPDPSEDPWGGGLPTLHGGASARNRPDTERDIREYEMRCTKDGSKPIRGQRMPGAGLSCATGRREAGEEEAIGTRTARGGPRRGRLHAIGGLRYWPKSVLSSRPHKKDRRLSTARIDS